MASAVAIAQTPPPPPPATMVSPWIYVNRCSGGCLVHGASVNDARTQTSSTPCPAPVQTQGGSFCESPGGDWTISEFKDSSGNTGAAADAEWQMIVACMQKVYSPYALTVTDQLPPGGVSYNEAIVAGLPTEIGYPMSVGGLAPPIGCVPGDNVISFSFANLYGGQQAQRVLTLCAVASQETAHTYGLDHAFEYPDHRSACTDPMSYRPDCGPRFFRNAFMSCGEYAVRGCTCGGLQNSHQRMLSIFGPGTPTTTPPDVSILAPTAGQTITAGAEVQAMAGAERGIDKLELYLNGYKWLTVPGAAFGPSGQMAQVYPVQLPANVPDGVIDIQVKAYDDLPVETDSAIVTVTKGAPCVDATTCLTGQQCAAGKCFWGTPTGALGDACTYPQFCVSNECQQFSNGKMLCTQDCIPNVGDSCPAMYDCIDAGNGQGYCAPATPAAAGCCSADASPSGPIALSLGVLGLAVGRRRRRV